MLKAVEKLRKLELYNLLPPAPLKAPEKETETLKRQFEILGPKETVMSYW